MSATPQKLDSPLASDHVRQQLLVIQRIVRGLCTAYHANLMVSQSLSKDFDRVALAAAENFTRDQKHRIRDHATMKAIREFPGKLNIDDHTPKNMADFLRHCFSDSCGHILTFSFKNDPTEDDAIVAMTRALMINTALDENESNYRLILGGYLEGFAQLDTMLGQFRSAVRDMNETIDNIAEGLHIDPATVSAMSEDIVGEKLRRNSTGISHLSYIQPSVWRGEPFSLT